MDEQLRLILQAQTQQWNAAFAQMQASAAALGGTVSQVVIKMGDVEKAAKKAGDVKWTDLTTGLSSAIGLVDGFVKKTTELAHFGAEMKNLEARVPVERLKMMQEATEGAVQKADLMRFSMKAMNGEMRLTESGLEKVLKAANTLGDKGFGDTAENAEKMLDALRKGASKELREFGIELKDTADKHANVNAMMKEFAKLAQESPPVDEGLKEIERVQTAWADFVDDVKAGLGGIILQIGHGIAELLGLMEPSKARKMMSAAQVGAMNAANMNMGSGLPSDTAGSWRRDAFMMTPEQIAAAQKKDDEAFRAYQVALAQGLAHEVAQQQWAQRQADLRAAMRPENFARGLKTGMKEAAAEWDGSMSRGGPGKKQDTNPWEGLTYGLQRGVRGIGIGVDRLTAGITDFTGLPQGVGSAFASLTPGGFGAGSGIGGIGTGWSGSWGVDEAMIKRLEEFNAKINDSTTAVGAGYKVMTSAAQAAVEAAISGSESLASAARKASAAALQSIALEATAKAVFSVAEAIFTRDPTKLVAAAEYGTAAALAAAGAAALGGSGSAAGSGRRATPSALPGGGYAAGGGGGNSGGPTYYNVYVGDGFVGRPDELAVAIADKLSHGVQSGRVTNLAQIKPGAVTIRS